MESIRGSTTVSENDSTTMIRQASGRIIVAVVLCAGVALIYLSVIAISDPLFGRAVDPYLVIHLPPVSELGRTTGVVAIASQDVEEASSDAHRVAAAVGAVTAER